ncbi:MAG: RagB/SusD family nutrient uptake outer membrane protein [Bacteroidales bacterium]|nr:RagB/SusD family nutrient uptake outer membrane protein [Bacteroidales bacterium]MBO4743669.1 RagB/SusD family nutrient uptake outer membrane protein [Bacteroidales bacterium]
MMVGLKSIALIAASAAALLIVSCQEPAQSISDTPEDVFQVSVTSITIPAEGGEESFTVNSTVAWTARVSQEWLSVTPDSGEAGDVSVTVTAEKNPSEEPRTATISLLVNDNEKAVISLTQEKGVIIKVPPISEEEAQAMLDRMYRSLGAPNLHGYSTPDDFGFLADMFSNDVEGADLILPDTGYNLFDICGKYDRNPKYRNYTIRFETPWWIINEAAKVIAGLGDNESPVTSAIKGQARALRAHAYLALAGNIQLPPSYDPNAGCLPILDENVSSPADLASASVKEVYDFIVLDLAAAELSLANYSRENSAKINIDVVHALQARTFLMLEDWQKAGQYASLAAASYTPASIEEVSMPSFMDISEHNWIWGFDMSADIALDFKYATTSSWLRSFSGWAYSSGTGTYACINKILYDKIPASDVRKGWWLDKNLYSPLLEGLTWVTDAEGSASGQAVADFEYEDKKAFIPYTNVKFGCDPVGTVQNSEDMPLVRVEEMILIQAECAARQGNTEKARNILNSFVKEYRDPSYSTTANGFSILDEIWYQRRVELWGEGFARRDILRLGKPLVRFVSSKESNIDEPFCFNLSPYDTRLIIPVSEKFLSEYPKAASTYSYNYGFASPWEGEGLRDGVTD